MKIGTTPTNNYFRWLCEKVDYRSRDKYIPALKLLFETDFYSLINYDDNRALDGLNLRREFEEETKLELPRDPCSVFEMMIGLSLRMAFIYYDPWGREDDNSVWFWVIFSNLGLGLTERVNKEIIDVLLERKYLPNGRGGLFPLKNPREDQRNIEIWYQMQAYVQDVS